MVNRSLLYGGLSSLALFLVACPTAQIASVTVSPSTAQSLVVGATLPVTATVVRASGNTTAAQTVTWSSSNTAVATVAPATGSAPNNAATVTAVAAGTTTIRAQSTVDASKFATFQLTVTPASGGIASVTTTPAAGSTNPLTVGATLAATATVTRVAGNTTAAQTVTWSTSNAAIASVNPTAGVAPTNATTITGVAAGTATITATSTADPTKTSAFTVNVTATPPVAVAVRRRNAGGPEIAATSGIPFAADPSVGGDGSLFWNCGPTDNNSQQGLIGPPITATIDVSAAGPNAAPAVLYQTNHYCPNSLLPPLRYDSTTTDAGTYTVRLHFAETYYGAPLPDGNGAPTGAGARVMRISVASGTTVLVPAGTTTYDIFVLAGGPNRAYVLDIPIPTPLTAGQELDVIFDIASGQDPFVNGIEYIRTGP